MSKGQSFSHCMQSLLLQHTHHVAISAWINALDVTKEKKKIQAVAIKWPALNFDQFWC